MFANGQSLFLVTLLILNVYADSNDINYEDDLVGSSYVDSKDVTAAKMEMLANGNGYGTNWIVMPDGNGQPRIAILSMNWENDKSETPMDKSFLTISDPPEKTVKFYLFTRLNPNRGVIFDRASVDKLNFTGSKPLKIVIHGWRSSSDSSMATAIRDAYLEAEDVNVIVVDWSGPAGDLFYPASADYTKKVGRYVSELIDDLASKKGVKYDNIHVIGHSLGAHTAGIAGFNTAKPLARVTGLDPALPGFETLASAEDRLDSSDAKFVDVIHTCSGKLGMSSPLGHADFYPNGGSPFQPGCCCITELIGTCSHGRSHEYFAESILSETAFVGIKCDSWYQFTQNSCEDYTVSMGEFVPTTARGVFYLETNSNSPFGMELEGTEYTGRR